MLSPQGRSRLHPVLTFPIAQFCLRVTHPVAPGSYLDCGVRVGAEPGNASKVPLQSSCPLPPPRVLTDVWQSSFSLTPGGARRTWRSQSVTPEQGWPQGDGGGRKGCTRCGGGHCFPSPSPRREDSDRCCSLRPADEG